MPFLDIILKVLFGGLFLVYWIGTFVILYHLTRFGVGVQPKKFAAIFLFGSVTLSVAVVIIFTKIDLTSITKLLS